MRPVLRAAMLALFLAATPGAWAQAFPAKPIKIITGFGPGGMGNVVTHLFAEDFGRKLGQPVIVEDRPGASNTIGAKAVMSSPADGYTLHMGGINSNPALFKNGIDLSKEMEPVALAVAVPLVLVTSAAHPLKTLPEIKAFAAKTPGGIFFGSAGGGAAQHMMMALLSKRAGGIPFTHVPFKGSGELQSAIARGEMHAAFLSAVSSMPLIRAGKKTPVLTGGDTRSSLLPDVPTLAEAGLKPFSTDSLMMVWAPKGTPPAIIRKLNEAAQAVAKDPKYIEAMSTRLGVTPVAMTPEQMLKMYQEAINDIVEASALVNYKPE